MKNTKKLWALLNKSVEGWFEDNAARMGAALAFYTVFSLAPLLLIAIAVAGVFFGREAAHGEIVHQLENLLGFNGARAIELIIEGASDKPTGILATTIGIGTLFIGATTVFSELKSSLDQIWQAPRESKIGVIGWIKGRLLSFGLILGIGFLLLVSLIFSAGITAFNRYWAVFIAEAVLLEAINFLVSFGLITVLFAMIYKWLPSKKISWRDVWRGAVITAFLFIVGKSFIGLYLGHSAISSSFGAASSLVVLLLWVYYSAQIFLFGAEFTKAYVYSYESSPMKSPNKGDK